MYICNTLRLHYIYRDERVMYVIYYDSTILCRDVRVKALQQELELEKAKVTILESQLEQLKGEKSGKIVKGKVDIGREEDTEDPLSPPQKQVLSGPITRSASYSNLSAPHARSAAGQAVNTSSHSSSSQHGERRSTITDMVSECLKNPSSMASIRSNLKADNLTPKIKKKFYSKTTSANLPSMQGVTSPLARGAVRAPDSLSSSPQSCDDLKDK